MNTSKIVNLYGPNQERIAHIRQWHQQQASAQSVATLNLSITADNQVRTQSVAVEPEHAVVMLEELRNVMGTLQAFIEAHGMQMPADDLAAHGPNVVAFKRQAVAQMR